MSPTICPKARVACDERDVDRACADRGRCPDGAVEAILDEAAVAMGHAFETRNVIAAASQRIWFAKEFNDTGSTT